jgi:NAD+ diphosphatase
VQTRDGLDPPLAHLALSRSVLVRRGELRADPDLLPRLLGEPATRVLDVADGRTPVNADRELMLREPSIADDPADAAYLGDDDAGTSYVVVRGSTAGEGWVTLRDVGTALDDQSGNLLAEAVSLTNWHASHTHCPRCGAPTVSAQAGWTRVCSREGSEHYPRTDPAVIMAVVDDDDRLLLGHGTIWPAGRMSTLAGFVEPGESLEAAVRREVGEEVGIEIGDVIYRGSQPWPFPASIMLGFRAYATTTEIRVDGAEVDDARWFSRESMDAAIAAGELVISPSMSISRRLIEDWYGGPIAVTPGSEIWRPAGS